MDKGKLMMTIIIVLLVLLLGTVVAVSIYLVNMFGNDTPTGGNGTRTEIHVGPPRLQDIEPVAMGNITTNLATSANGRVGSVRTDISVGLDTRFTGWEDTQSELIRLESAARHIMINVFNSLTTEDVNTVEGRNAAAEIILTRLQEQFNSPLIVQVMFDSWILG